MSTFQIADSPWFSRSRPGTGIVSIAAGNGLSTFSGDGGLATGASLAYPTGLAVDSAGNLFIADSYNSDVRKVSPTGIITTVAGGGGASGFAGDGGLATKALLNLPTGVALDHSGNLYILDTGNDRVRMVSAATGIISTIAGSGNSGYSGDGGPAINASFSNPGGIAVDSSGNVYIADTNNSVIREITGSTINTVAGIPQKAGFTGDGGQATKANVSFPRGIAVDASGNLYIADTANQRIRRVSGGVINTIAGTGQAGFNGDGSAAMSALFSTPAAVALDSSANVYVSDLDNNRIRRFIPGGVVTTFAGTTTAIGDGGPSTQARLNRPPARRLTPRATCTSPTRARIESAK